MGKERKKQLAEESFAGGSPSQIKEGIGSRENKEISSKKKGGSSC